MKKILGIGIVLILASCGKTSIENYVIKKDKVNFENLVYLGVDRDNIIFTTSEDKYGSYSYGLKTKKVDTLDYLVTKKIEEEEIGRKYKNVVKTSKEGVYIYQNESGKYLLFNEKKNKKSEEYDIIEEVNEKYYLQKNELKGYIDENFNTIIPLGEYKYLGKIQDDIAIAFYNGKWGIAQKEFRESNFNYTEAYAGKNGNWIVKNQDGKYIDSNRKILEVDVIVQSPNSVVVYTKGDKMGVIDVNTLTMSLPLFEEVGVDEKTVVIATPSGEYIVAKLNDILKWKKDESSRYKKFVYVEKIGKDIYSGMSQDGKVSLIFEEKLIDKDYIEIFKKNNLFLCQKKDRETFDVYNSNGKLLTTTKKNDIKYIGEHYIVCGNDREYKIIKGVE